MLLLLLPLLPLAFAQPPPYYPPDPANVPASFACAWRTFALEYSTYLLPSSRSLAYDALQLGVLCNASLPSLALPSRPPLPAAPVPPAAAAASTVYVDGVHGSDSNSGSSASPLATVGAGLALSRTLPRPVTVLLRAATYYLPAPLVLTAADSHLTLSAAPGEEVWLSGAQPLPALAWRPYSVRPGGLQRLPGENNARGCTASAPSAPGCGCRPLPAYAECEALFNASAAATSFTWHNASTGANWATQCCLRTDGQWAPVPQAGHFSGRRQPPLAIYVATLPPALNLTAMPELRVGGLRYPRARYPNANPETDIYPTGWVTGGGSTWHPPRPAPPITPVSVFNAQLALRNSSENRNYSGALGGPCHVFEPPFSYWCSEHPAGGGGFQYYVPSGATLAPGSLPNFTVPEPGSGTAPPLFHLWRAAHWANWAFELLSFAADTQRVEFGIGGFQGARGGPGSDYFVENALALLDAPTEWYYDAPSRSLYLYSNDTSGLPPGPAVLLEAPQLRSLLLIAATQGAPAVNVSLLGLGFKDSAPTFMDPHAVPSGGDWALERAAAVLAEGVQGLTVAGCTFSRVGGNALMLSGFARDSLLQGNAFHYTGGSAMVAWGRTDEVSAGGALGWDATGGDFPMRTAVRGNVASEVGVWMKQNSCWAQFKAALTTLEGNVCFNVGRAGFNFGDGLGGGDEVHSNLIFNTNRESADHGPINSWDRQPYVTTLFDGTPSARMLPRNISGNMLVGNYGGGNGPVDNDDGSLWFNTHHNLLVYGHQKFKVGGIRSYSNVMAYVTDFAGKWGGPGELAWETNAMHDNRVVFASQGAAYHDCTWTGALAQRNALYGQPAVQGAGCKGSLTLQAWQQLDPAANDVGSTVNATLPTGEEIMQWARELLM